MVSLAEQLREQFLSGGQLNWQGLGGGIVGGLFTALWLGIIQLPLSIGRALEAYYARIAGGVEDGGGAIASAVESSSSAAWDPVSSGLFALPVSLAVVLATFAVIALGWNRYA